MALAEGPDYATRAMFLRLAAVAKPAIIAQVEGSGTPCDRSVPM